MLLQPSMSSETCKVFKVSTVEKKTPLLICFAVSCSHRSL